MKIKLTELRRIVRKCILEVTDPNAAAQRVSKLLDDALENPSLSSPPLFGFLRTLGVEGRDIRTLKLAIDSSDVHQAQNIVNGIVKDKLRVEMRGLEAVSSSASGTRRKIGLSNDLPQNFKAS